MARRGGTMLAKPFEIWTKDGEVIIYDNDGVEFLKIGSRKLSDHGLQWQLALFLRKGQRPRNCYYFSMLLKTFGDYRVYFEQIHDDIKFTVYSGNEPVSFKTARGAYARALRLSLNKVNDNVLWQLGAANV
jgi:hypothetical protein